MSRCDEKGSSVGSVDWSATWLVPFRDIGEDLARHTREGASRLLKYLIGKSP
jgi:hypothetical protein